MNKPATSATAGAREATHDAGDAAQDSDATLAVKLPSAGAVAHPGTAIGRYVVVDELGRGGMGIVLRAYDPKLQREVALKIVHKSDDSRTSERLTLEARAMAQISHPNVVSVFDIEASGQQVVLAMELVKGTDLRRWLADRERPWRVIVDAFVQAGRGLEAEHRCGLLHRDFKPANVLMSLDGVPKVTDFGLVRVDRRFDSISSASPRSEESYIHAPELTARGFVIGTPAYMAPEQHGPGPLDPKVDQFAFCVSLWQALTGTLPFPVHGVTPSALSAAKRAGPPSWPREGERVPPPIVRAIVRGLSPDPNDRWPDMAALLRELSTDPNRRRRRRIAAFARAFIVLFGAGAWKARQMIGLAQCEHASTAIHDHWGPSRAERIAAAFEATGVPHWNRSWRTTEAKIDEFVANWAEARYRVCSTRELEENDDQLLWRSLACLEDASASIRALLDEWEHATEAGVDRAVTAAWHLPDLDRCTNDEDLRWMPIAPSDAESRDAEQRIRGVLRASEARIAVGDFEGALESAQSARDAAAEAGLDRVALEARQEIVDALNEVGRYEAMLTEARTLYYDANVAGEKLLAAESAASLTWYSYYHAGDLAAAEHWHWLATMACDERAVPDDHPLRGLLADRQRYLWMGRGEYDRLRRDLSSAIDRARERAGPRHPEIGVLLLQLAHAEAEEDPRTALEILARAYDVFEEHFGPEHPEAATFFHNFGAFHLKIGNLDEALVWSERARSNQALTLERGHPDVARTLSLVGRIHAARGELDRAIEVCDESIAIWTAAGVDNARARFECWMIPVDALMNAQRFADALHRIEQAWSLGGELQPVLRAKVAFARALALEGLGRLAEARTSANEAVALLDAAPVDDDVTSLRQEIRGWQSRAAP